MMNSRFTVKSLLIIMCVCALWAMLPAAYGQSFKEANQFYKENKYDQAIEAYEKTLAHGFESGNLYYNLGNSYFKKGEIGRALLNYERSRLFIPADSDLRSNYKFVRSLLNVASGARGPRGFLKLIDVLFDGAGLNGSTTVVSVLWISLLVLLSVYLLLPLLKPYVMPLCVICAAALIVSSVALARKIGVYEHGAVVIGKEVEAKFEPVNGATTYFKLAEGSPVFILDRAANWVKIRRPDSKIGWVASGDVAGIRE